MDRVFGFPEIVRFSWSSCARILDESAMSVFWNDPVEEDNKPFSAKKRPIDQSAFAPKKKPTSIFSLYHLSLADF